MITLASLGIVWIVLCIILWVLHVKKTFASKDIKFHKKFIVMWKSPWLLDAFLSIIVILTTYIILMGVTGMVIGLEASVFLSLLLWLIHAWSSIFGKKDKKKTKRRAK